MFQCHRLIFRLLFRFGRITERQLIFLVFISLEIEHASNMHLVWIITIISNLTWQVKFLKKAVPQITNSKKKLKELVVRAVYVEMLGQDASFAYIKAVELCASTNILHKRVGYLAASLCLSPEHEFRFMLVNQIQRDINR